MNLDARETTELIPKDLIRVETALTRYPIHRLARRGNVEIEIKRKSEGGETTFQWEVDYSKKRGQPGPLAYKVDTLIINRCIDEAERPLPRVIKLGSLHEISARLGKASTRDTNTVKNAIKQNVGAVITSKLTYKGNDGSEHTEEFSNTRYGAAFVGDRLPDGGIADAVYIILNDWYWRVLSTAQTRPLDYDYLKNLTPGAQRLYELLSFQIYGAVESERKRAKLLYSEFCTFAPQTRYQSFEKVKKQMYKLNIPHKKSGYIAAVHFQETTDQTGQPDWEMFYTPGLKARGEHTAAKRKPRRNLTTEQEQLRLPVQHEPQTPAEISPAPASLSPALTDEQERLLEKLTAKGVTEIEARKLVTEKLDACRLKIPALDHLPDTQGKTNRGGNVRAFIERDDWQLPPSYLEAKAKEEEIRKAQAKKDAQETRQRDEEARRAAYFDFLKARAAETEKMQPAAYRAFLADAAAERADLERDPARKGQAKKILLRIFDDEQSQLERFKDYFNEPSFEDWNPQ